jgi:thiamine-monophosphate kinase
VQQTEDPGGEFRLIADYFSGLDGGAGVVLGGGDDAALLALEAGRELVVSTDNSAEGVHFPVGADPALAAYRAVAAAVSDLAAMGATPLAMTLNLSLPAADPQWLAACRRGLGRAVEAFDLPLVGGDLSRGALIFGVQVLGTVPAGSALTRGGAREGDRVCVSGSLGDAAAGLALLQARLAAGEQQRKRFLAAFWEPVPQLALGDALRAAATAAIDVSDGLLADVGHIADRSGVAITIDSARLPVSRELLDCVGRDRALQWALAGGEDYALCFTLPRGIALPEGCTWVGLVEAGTGVYCDVACGDAGYRHF